MTEQGQTFVPNNWLARQLYERDEAVRHALAECFQSLSSFSRKDLVKLHLQMMIHLLDGIDIQQIAR